MLKTNSFGLRNFDLRVSGAGGAQLLEKLDNKSLEVISIFKLHQIQKPRSNAFLVITL